MNPHDEQRLRELLEGSVSDVEPRHGLDAITARTARPSRTKVSSMSTRPWLYGVTGAVVATAATIAAFAVLGDDTGPTAGPDPVGSPSQTVTRDATDDSSPDAGPSVSRETLPVYYIGDTGQGPRLYREFHDVETADPALAAVQEALVSEPLDPDYRTPWAGLGADVASVTHEGGTITVDLTGDLRDRPGALGKAEAGMAVEQLLYTVQGALQSRDPVQLLLNGERTDQVLGVPTSEPLAQGDELSTLALVWIIDPQDGDTLQSGSEVSGVGAFFEANVIWELKQGEEIVESGFTTAEECCRVAPYSFELPDVPAGEYLLVVRDDDASGGEGPEPFRDTKRITIG